MACLVGIEKVFGVWPLEVNLRVVVVRILQRGFTWWLIRGCESEQMPCRTCAERMARLDS